ncbi:Alpha/beta hydrolase family protein [Streptoalloteichus tenebrarius]|uniref:Alpha/beta hydrolase family protein n=1 Tax=Streptoalloteichus tenebrarius (strain ATCC 17920 / DSM 40477 / JCM 4838 / CBS 697.72 / NBRC 16177 / NCIMB 11028 / NRRL B-12390 / A12253. 1 / ISP 5477) TaxID=1933 RepID=A0ABT1HNM4_STRSD|nr:prolyl oligopeptidase family serine peptidase [Streptoalloteichus tenebrarius]MCP2257112.1 Alpha/beta hydrolase family protein [Streptoalloteichus tenebrarius]
MRSPMTGTAAGVPFTALPPADDGPAPLIVTWHMLDAPRSDAAFAAALPMNDLPAWRVHLGMPMCGARMVNGSMDAGLELMREDVLMSFLHPFVRQAFEEFPAALESIRAQLPVDDGPIGVLGGSLGGAVALRVLAETEIPIFAGAVVNAAIRMRSVVDLFPGDYPYDAESEKAVDSLDFIAKADALAAHAPLLVVSGELDHPGLRADAIRLVEAMGERAELLSIPGLAHPLAEEPGIEPAPQLPIAREVDAGLTAWFRRHLTPAG